MNNTQKLKKGVKEVENLGILGTTALLIEISEALKKRLEILKKEETIYNNPIYSKQSAIKVMETFLNELI